MYYAGLDCERRREDRTRHRQRSATARSRAAAPAVLDVGAGDASSTPTSVKDPVVVKVERGDYRMLYTGVETLDGTRSSASATRRRADGIAWTKRGVVLDPSLTAYASDESGVEPTGLLVDGSTLHVWTSGVDRSGRTRGDHATTPYPTPVTPQPGIPSGWATYQLGDASTTNRDFRQIVAHLDRQRRSTLWMSFLQPYSANGDEFWSDYFPVTVSEPDRGPELPAHRPRRPLAGAPLRARRRARRWTRSSSRTRR